MILSEEMAKAWVASLCGNDSLVMSRLEALIQMLELENTRQNLVSAMSLAHIWQRHIADSLQLLRHTPADTLQSTWLDLGSGAGFPGLALAAFNPGMRITLVESRSRRVEWLEYAVRALSLDRVDVDGRRIEHVSSRPYDTIVARAFAPLASLVDLAERFSTAQTTWILPKGKSAERELLSLTQWHHTFHVEQSITDADAGIVVGNIVGRKGSQP